MSSPRQLNLGGGSGSQAAIIAPFGSGFRIIRLPVLQDRRPLQLLHFVHTLYEHWCYNERVAANIATVIAYLSEELPRLIESGENWQLVLHGGRGGDISSEIKTTKQLVRPRTPTPPAPNNCRG